MSAVDPLAERLLESNSVFTGRLLHLHVDEVEQHTGGRARREVVDHPGAVCIVPRAADGRLVLVRQWRHPVGRALWELPAGTRDPGEDPETTAERELAEETGYTAKRWTRLGSGAVAPGYSTEVIHYFLAEELTDGETSPDEDEHVEARLFSVEEIGHLLASGEVDLKTIAGLAMVGIPVTPRG